MVGFGAKPRPLSSHPIAASYHCCHIARRGGIGVEAPARPLGSSRKVDAT